MVCFIYLGAVPKCCKVQYYLFLFTKKLGSFPLHIETIEKVVWEILTLRRKSWLVMSRVFFIVGHSLSLPSVCDGKKYLQNY